MALADFTFDANGVDAASTITGSSPIQGAGSYDVVISLNSTVTWALCYTAGLTKDCVELKVLFQARNSAPGPDFGIGGIFAQMQGGPGISTSAYEVMFTGGTPGGASTLILNKATPLSSAGSGSGVASVAITLPALSGTGALGLRCEYNAGGNNVLLTASYDQGPITTPVSMSYDFPGLVPVLTYLDASSPYTTGTFGLFGRCSGGFGTQQQIFDVLSVDTD